MIKKLLLIFAWMAGSSVAIHAVDSMKNENITDEDLRVYNDLSNRLKNISDPSYRASDDEIVSLIHFVSTQAITHKNCLDLIKPTVDVTCTISDPKKSENELLSVLTNLSLTIYRKNGKEKELDVLNELYNNNAFSENILNRIIRGRSVIDYLPQGSHFFEACLSALLHLDYAPGKPRPSQNAIQDGLEFYKNNHDLYKNKLRDSNEFNLLKKIENKFYYQEG